jgi:hypothetical protein
VQEIQDKIAEEKKEAILPDAKNTETELAIQKEVAIGKKRVSLSLSSVSKIKELNQEKQKEVNLGEHLTESFTQEDIEKHWNEYAKILEQRGKKIILSYMTLSKPIVMGTNILLEFPNEGSKEDFENANTELLDYLRTNLRNYDIKIKIKVIETFKPKVIYKPEDIYQHFKEINPLIEQFRQNFELDI